MWTRHTQRAFYPAVVSALENKTSHPLVSQLRLKFDSLGLIRCYGRFSHAGLSDDTANPKLLPRRTTFTRLLIRHDFVNKLQATLPVTSQDLSQVKPQPVRPPCHPLGMGARSFVELLPSTRWLALQPGLNTEAIAFPFTPHFLNFPLFSSLSVKFSDSCLHHCRQPSFLSYPFLSVFFSIFLSFLPVCFTYLRPGSVVTPARALCNPFLNFPLFSSLSVKFSFISFLHILTFAPAYALVTHVASTLRMHW